MSQLRTANQCRPLVVTALTRPRPMIAPDHTSRAFASCATSPVDGLADRRGHEGDRQHPRHPEEHAPEDGSPLAPSEPHEVAVGVQRRGLVRVDRVGPEVVRHQSSTLGAAGDLCERTSFPAPPTGGSGRRRRGQLVPHVPDGDVAGLEHAQDRAAPVVHRPRRPGPTASSMMRHGGAGRTTSSSAPPTRTRVPGRFATAPWLSVSCAGCGRGHRRTERSALSASSVADCTDTCRCRVPWYRSPTRPAPASACTRSTVRIGSLVARAMWIAVTTCGRRVGHPGAGSPAAGCAARRPRCSVAVQPVPDLDDDDLDARRTRGSAAPCPGTGGRRGSGRSRGCRRSPAHSSEPSPRSVPRARESAPMTAFPSTWSLIGRPASLWCRWSDAVAPVGCDGGSAEALGPHRARVEAGGRRAGRPRPRRTTSGRRRTRPGPASGTAARGARRLRRDAGVHPAGSERQRLERACPRGTGIRRRAGGPGDVHGGGRPCRRATRSASSAAYSRRPGVVTEARTTTGAVGSAARHIARSGASPDPPPTRSRGRAGRSRRSSRRSGRAPRGCRRRRCRARGRWRPRRPRPPAR